MKRIRHSKKQLKSALDGSYRELSKELKKILTHPQSFEFFNLTKKASGAFAWTGNSLFSYLADQVGLKKKESFSLEEKALLESLAQGKRPQVPLETLFNVIHKDIVLSHTQASYKSLLPRPRMDFTLVLISGVLNEIFNTAPFEKGAKVLKKKYGLKYFAPKIDGTKGSEENALSLEKQLKAYIEKNPGEKLWLLAHSKGGLDSLHFLKNNVAFAEKYILGLSTIATPILGSKHTEHALLKMARLIHEVPKKISKDIDWIAESAQVSLSYKYQEHWFRKNHQLLPKGIFYSALALEAPWYESHVWMLLTKAFFLIQGPNDGVVLVKEAQFPKYFKAYNLGVMEGHHLIGARSSSYIQEALIEAHCVLFTCLNVI